MEIRSVAWKIVQSAAPRRFLVITKVYPRKQILKRAVSKKTSFSVCFLVNFQLGRCMNEKGKCWREINFYSNSNLHKKNKKGNKVKTFLSNTKQEQKIWVLIHLFLFFLFSTCWAITSIFMCRATGSSFACIERMVWGGQERGGRWGRTEKQVRGGWKWIDNKENIVYFTVFASTWIKILSSCGLCSIAIVAIVNGSERRKKLIENYSVLCG